MFTGLVEEIGEILRVENGKQKDTMYRRFRISCQKIRKDMSLGDSINVNGACQTVVKRSSYISYLFSKKAWFEIESLQMTLEKTNFSEVSVGSEVNLERSLQLKSRLGGHIVTGHVQITAKVSDMLSKEENTFISIEIPQEYEALLIEEGSVCVNGISLTIAKIERRKTTVIVVINLIEHTVKNTNMRSTKEGDSVNIEFDILYKYAQQAIDKYLKAKSKR